ncbi:MAG: PQQ-binding-like beta-propeller repeat protein [Phycisphaeraceae bacterium]
MGQRQRSGRGNSWRCLGLLCAACGLVAALSLAPAWAEKMVWIGPQQFGGEMVASDGSTATAVDVALDVDTELNGFLRQANALAAEKKYPQAAQLLHQLIIKPGSVVSPIHEGGTVYQPIRRAAEATILALPDDGVAAYRVMVDSNAALLQRRWDERGDVDALRELGLHYLGSSYGEEAAYRLAGLAMDRYDFTGAAHWLEKIEDYPHARISARDLLTRLVVAQARIGNVKAAAGSLKKLGGLAIAPTPALLASLSRELDAAAARYTLGEQSAIPWAMDWGTPARDGGAPEPLTDLAQGGDVWTIQWMMPYAAADDWKAQVSPYANLQAGQETQSRQELVRRWLEGQWRPTTALYLDGQRLYLKDRGMFFARETDSGGIGQTGWNNREGTPDNEERNVQSANRYYGRQNTNTSGPSSMTELWLFREGISKAATLHDGVIYAIDPQGLIPWTSSSVVDESGVPGLVIRGRMGGGFGNRLSAYRAAGGKLLWRTTAGLEMDGALSRARFVAAPLPVGDLLVAPVEGHTGEMLLVGLDPRQGGKLVWKTLLVADAGRTSLGWSPVGLAAVGSEVYVATGRGAVFAVDGASGTVRWASRYQRSMPGQLHMSRFMESGYSSIAGGWEQDVIVPRANLVVVLPSDSRRILLFDRDSGRPVADKDDGLEAALRSYVLGVRGDLLFLAGAEDVRCYDLAAGMKLRWQTTVPTSYGRGMLTRDNRIYLPQRYSVLRLDADNGRRLGEIKVRLPFNDPVGNLFSDGRRLYITGLDGVYALMDAASQLAELTRRVNQGDATALVERARLHRRLNRHGPAVADLRQAVPLLMDAQQRAAATSDLVNGLVALAQEPAASGAGDPLALLDEARRLAAEPGDQSRVDLALARIHLRQDQLDKAIDLLTALALRGGAELVEVDAATTGARAAHEPQGVLQAAVSELAIALLEELANQQPARVAPLLEQKGQAALTAAGSDPAVLAAVVRAFPGAPAALAAARRAAGAMADHAGFGVERGEVLLSDLTRSPQRDVAAQAWALLAEFHQSLGWRDQAARDWRLLATQYTDVSWTSQGQPVIASALAEQALVSLGQTSRPGAAQGGAASAPLPAMPAPPWRIAWAEASSASEVLNPPAWASSAFFDRHVLYYSASQGQLVFRDSADGKIVWATRLADQQRGFDRLGPGATLLDGVYLHQGRLPQQDHVGILRSDGRLVGLGLVSGRRLWEQAIENEGEGQLRLALMQRPGQHQPGYKISVGDGVIAESFFDPATIAQRVVVREADSGRILWQRQFDGDDVAGVAVAAGCVNVLLDRGKEMWIGDRRTGATLNRLPVSDYEPGKAMLWTRLGPLYRTRGGEWNLLGVPDGKRRFGGSITRSVINVGLVDEQTFYLANEDGSVGLVTMANGKVSWSGTPQTDAAGIISDVAMSPDRRHLYLLFTEYDQQRPQIMGQVAQHGTWQAQPNQAKTAVLVMDMAGRQTILNRVYNQLPGMQTPPDMHDLAASGDLLPWPLQGQQPGGKRRYGSRLSGSFEVAFYRKTDAALMEDLELPAPPGKEAMGNIRRLPQIIGDSLLINCDLGLICYRHDASPPAGP